MNTKQVDNYLKVLKRRESFLQRRIAEREDENKTHHDRHELYAISWAIHYIEDTKITATEHQSGRFKEKFNGEDTTSH